MWQPSDKNDPVLIRNMKRYLLSLLALTLILIAAVAWYFHLHPPAGNLLFRQPEIHLHTVGQEDLTDSIELSGDITSKSRLDVYAPYKTKVLRIDAIEGQTVTAGQIILQLDPAPLDSAIAEAQKQASLQENSPATTVDLAQAQADYDRAAAHYQKYKALYATGAIARRQMEAAENAYTAAEQALNHARGQTAASSGQPGWSEKVRLLEQQKDHLSLRAPQDGQLHLYVQVLGQELSPGQPVFSVRDLSQTFVHCFAPASELTRLHPGMAAQVHLSDQQTLAGQIISCQPDPQLTQTAVIRIQIILLPQQPPPLGQNARVSIPLPLKNQVLAVPYEALVEVNQQTGVFIADADNRVHFQAVTIGAEGKKWCEIRSGVQAGDRVAVSGTALLQDGQLIIPNKE